MIEIIRNARPTLEQGSVALLMPNFDGIHPVLHQGRYLAPMEFKIRFHFSRSQILKVLKLERPTLHHGTKPGRLETSNHTVTQEERFWAKRIFDRSRFYESRDKTVASGGYISKEFFKKLVPVGFYRPLVKT